MATENKIGNKIRLLREQRGLSQDNLALSLGITQPSYARLEKDDDRINITRLIQIASLLKTTVGELIDEKTQKVSNQNNNETAYAYNADTIGTIVNADKEHIQSLKEEIAFLKELVGGSSSGLR